MKNYFLIIFLYPMFIFSAEPYQPSFWDIIPGVGQYKLGHYYEGAFQFGLFASFIAGASEMSKRKDFIHSDQIFVKFSIEDAITADILEKQGFLYKDYRFITESYYQRLQRLVELKILYEINPLLQYGNYERKTYANANRELLSQSAMHVFFYSTYSTYRDSGRIDTIYNESFLDLAFVPFQWKYISNYYFWIPIGLLSTVLAYQSVHSPKHPEWIIISPSMKKSGYMNFYSTVVSFNAGVGEEAFFRGFLNHYFIHRTGDVNLGILLSSILFGLGHYQTSPLDVIFPTIAGVYFGYLHYIHNWDIRQGIAIHFWWDFLIFTFQIRYMKEDKNVFKNQREIHFMPIIYTYKF